MEYTLTFSEDAKGWTSFWSFIPDAMVKLGNTFYTIKNGQLFRHNEDTGVQNNFYGVQYTSKIKTLFNEANAEDKIFKTIVLETNDHWEVKVATNYSASTIKATEFNKRESRYFSHIRKNEDPNDLHGNTAQGIGTIASLVDNAPVITVFFTAMPSFVNVGDSLYQLNGNAKELIGEITASTESSLTVGNALITPLTGLFCFSKKNARIEGSEIRGYYMEIELENTNTEKVELFAVNTNVVKSYL
jgi:hypothetical protein